MELLDVQDVTKSYGGLIAVNHASLYVKEGTIIGLIGPNGAGKTTLLDLVCGFYKPETGKVFFKDKKISGLRPYNVAKRGIGRTFQITRIFRNITSLENMFVPITWLPGDVNDLKKKALKLLEFFEIIHLKDEYAKNLSGGQQKLLELARASMIDPELFLLDEPFYGIHPVLKTKLIERVRILNRDEKKTFLVISHDIPSIMNLCEEVLVMNAGEMISRGTPQEVRSDERVLEAYLGV